MRLLLAVLVLVEASVNAQTITTQTFGSGTNQFSIDFVTIGNPGNAAAVVMGKNSIGPFPPSVTYYTNGSVAYLYSLGKYEISREILSKANTLGNLGLSMADITVGERKPVQGITWYDAARFVNFLNVNHGYSPAYQFDSNNNFQLWAEADPGYSQNNRFRNSRSIFVLPTIDEWFKGAFGSPQGNWYRYATGSNEPPQAVSSGVGENLVVYGQPNPPFHPDIDNAGSLSAFGTMAQTGNVWEWCESASDGFNDNISEPRDLMGGGWGSSLDFIESSHRMQFVYPSDPPTNVEGYGFRIAMVPEPSSLSLLLVGGTLLFGLSNRTKNAS